MTRLLLILSFAGSTMLPAYGLTGNWSQPDIDSWLYENASFPGSNIYGSSFTGGLTVDSGTNKFDPSSAAEMARLSSVLFGFETSGQITPGLSPAEYDIQSVTLTVRFRSGVNGLSQYETAPVDPNQYLADFLAGGIAPQLPMELYGAGFRDGYEGLALGINQTGTRFSEASNPTGGGPTLVGHPDLETTFSYVAYPAVGDPNSPGQLVDVTNNITGGFSETAPGNLTDPFAATPWAVGTAPLSVGNDIPVNTTFTFDLNLSLPGVESYLQESLSEGAVGFVLSSLHDTTAFGDDGAFARWHSKEAVALNIPGAEAATLAIEYSFIAPTPDPDFNEDDLVDGIDFLVWQRDPNAYGGANGLAAWEAEYAGVPVVGAIGTVPEPSSLIYLIAGSLGMCKLMGHRRPC